MELEECQRWDVQSKFERPTQADQPRGWQLSKHHNQHEWQVKAHAALSEVQRALLDALVHCVVLCLARG